MISGNNVYKMTVSYTGDVANASAFGCFSKVVVVSIIIIIIIFIIVNYYDYCYY